jgi:tetratricopeptide (TPR) repeat protein
MRALLALGEGRFNEATKGARLAMSRGGASLWALRILAEQARRENNYGEAAGLFNRALALSPADGPALAGLFLTETARGGREKATELALALLSMAQREGDLAALVKRAKAAGVDATGMRTALESALTGERERLGRELLEDGAPGRAFPDAP